VSPHTPLRCSHAHLSVIVTDCARSAVTSAEKGVRRDATATTAATAAAEVTQRNYLSLFSLSLWLSLNGEEGTSSRTLTVFIFYSAGVGAAGKLVKPARATGGGEASQVGRD
jgi:hypothetical protein